MLSKFPSSHFTTNLTPCPAAVNTSEDRHVFQVMLVVASIVAMGDDETWRPLLRQYPVLQEAGHVQPQQQSTVILPHTHTQSLDLTVYLRPRYGYSQDSSHNHGAAVMSDVTSSHNCGAAVMSDVNSSHNHSAAVMSDVNSSHNCGAAVISDVNSSHNRSAAVMSDVNSSHNCGAAVISDVNSSHNCGAAVMSDVNSSHNRSAAVISDVNSSHNCRAVSGQL